MGYDLHVIRGDEWSDTDREQIPLDQWLALVDTDPSLELRNEISATTTTGETLTYQNEGLAIWTCHLDNSECPFDFRNGSIVVKNPDESTIAKLVEVAASLGARVQGDDGEFYPMTSAPEQEEHRRRWPFRR